MAGTDLQKFLDELRAKISIADVVGAKVKLTRKGREYTGLCPFHNEKTPSFTVNEAKGFYHCFGCGAHGDIIKFEMDANGLTFMESVEKLAHKVGLEVPRMNRESPEQTEKRNTAYDIMEMAAKFFEKQLKLVGGQRAREYLARRGFGDEIIAKFRLGYAPSNNGLKAQLASKGVTEQEMHELGLIAIPEDKNRRSHDFFRDRVMIPIMDKRGKVIAFGGRIMGDGQPKYLNSPETPVFNKRRVLYNLNHARDAAFQEKRLIICEGYMDVIGMDNYGIHYAVAPLGTALTEDQIQEAWKVVDEPTCCFDGDMAGKRAAIRSVDRVLPILKAGNSLKYVFLTGAKDPDEFLKAFGRDEFLKVISNTVPLKDLLWQKNTEDKPVSTPEQKALVEKNIKEEVAKIADETVRNYYAQDMQNKIYYELGKGSWRKRADAGYEERRSSHNSGYRRSDYRSAAPTVSLVGTIKTNLDDLMAQYVVSALYCYPELLEEYEERLYNFEFKNARLRAILDMMLEAVREDESLADAEKMAAYLEEKGMGKDVKELLECKMMRRQNPDVIKMRAHLDARIVEEQLCQLDLEIKECLRQIESCESFPEDVFGRYQSLKKEREAILAAQDSD
jgi:DNA primase